MMPVMGIVQAYHVETFRAEYLVPENHMSYFIENNEEFATRIKDELSQGLARGLLDNGAIIIRINQIMGIGTKYAATVRVAMPEGEYGK